MIARDPDGLERSLSDGLVLEALSLLPGALRHNAVAFGADILSKGHTSHIKWPCCSFMAAVLVHVMTDTRRTSILKPS